MKSCKTCNFFVANNTKCKKGTYTTGKGECSKWVQPSAIGKPTIIGFDNPENFERMKDRHKKEIDDLQSNCKHKNKSDWMPYMWAPGHMGNPVKVCKWCGKIVATQRTMISKRDLLTPTRQPKK